MRIGPGTGTIKFRGKSAERDSSMNRSPSARAAIPFIDRTARLISDPVVRLRFLRAAAPAWQPKQAWNFSQARPAGLVLLAPAALLAAGRFAMERRDAKAFSHSRAAVAVTANPVNAPVLVIPAGMALPKAESAPQI